MSMTKNKYLGTDGDLGGAGTFTDVSLAQLGTPDVHTVEWDPAAPLEAKAQFGIRALHKIHPESDFICLLLLSTPKLWMTVGALRATPVKVRGYYVAHIRGVSGQ